MKLRMEETCLYRDAFADGREQHLQMFQAALIACWRERFGTDELGEQRIRRLRDPKKLLNLMGRIATAPTPSAALSSFPAE